VTVAYTTGRPTRIRRPPTDGPPMVASWMTDVFSATALPYASRGTRLMRIAWLVGMLNARLMPTIEITTKMGTAEVRCTRLKPSSAALATAVSRYVPNSTRRRS